MSISFTEIACTYALRMAVVVFSSFIGADKTYQNTLSKIGKIRTLKQQ
ncbi:hypothetical protein [Arcicella rigui]|uniref:Uncharacterized protein n=1 Tax=Arcicella rigui TaxID=797020 RepID=A0ABU5QEG5_9BACT|nr:hypothetical protein [Arcicella rigui]MEA5141244.1 hypothetical protein [Arcicella rigui]